MIVGRNIFKGDIGKVKKLLPPEVYRMVYKWANNMVSNAQSTSGHMIKFEVIINITFKGDILTEGERITLRVAPTDDSIEDIMADDDRNKDQYRSGVVPGNLSSGPVKYVFVSEKAVPILSRYMSDELGISAEPVGGQIAIFGAQLKDYKKTVNYKEYIDNYGLLIHEVGDWGQLNIYKPKMETTIEEFRKLFHVEEYTGNIVMWVSEKKPMELLDSRIVISSRDNGGWKVNINSELEGTTLYLGKGVEDPVDELYGILIKEKYLFRRNK